MEPGIARSVPAMPIHSGPTVGARTTSLPVTAELKLEPAENVIFRPAGNSRVFRFTCAPLKSPGCSGVNDLEVVMVSSKDDGNRSSGTTFRSGSGLGIRALFNDVVV